MNAERKGCSIRSTAQTEARAAVRIFSSDCLTITEKALAAYLKKLVNMPSPKPKYHNADRRIVACNQCTLDIPLSAIDLPAMRTRLVELTDAASNILFGERLDFDDVIVDRFILAEANSLAVFKVPADWLSDRERLIEHVASFVRKQINASGIASVDATNIRITGLVVEIVQQAGPI